MTAQRILCQLADQYLWLHAQLCGNPAVNSCVRPSHKVSLSIPLSQCRVLCVSCALCNAPQPGQQLDLGKGHVLEFIAAPNLHWPDTMFTLDRGTGVMYTCDAFGMHYCSELVRTEFSCCSHAALQRCYHGHGTSYM